MENSFLESDTNEFIYKTNRLTDIENKLRVTKGKWKKKNIIGNYRFLFMYFKYKGVCLLILSSYLFFFFHFPFSNHVCFLCLWVCFCSANKFICISFLKIRFYTWVISYGIWLSVCLSMTISRSVLLQMTLFHSFLWLSSIPLFICITSLFIWLWTNI